MTEVQDWLVDKNDLNEVVSVKIAEKLPEFKIRTLTGTELHNLQKSAIQKVRSRSGQITQETDTDKFMNNLIEESVVEPNLKDNQIQEYYGTIGDAAGTVRAMLTAGQYQKLTEKISDISGLNSDEDEIEEVKN